MRTLRAAPIALFSALVAIAAAPLASAAEPSTRTLESLYARIGEDVRAGRPLIIHAYYGMWQARADEPDRNLNWGVYYGHKTMLERARRDSHIKKLYRYRDWRLVHEQEGGGRTRSACSSSTSACARTERGRRRASSSRSTSIS